MFEKKSLYMRICFNKKIVLYAKMVSNLKKFIEKAERIHGNKYDYSKVKYIDSKTKVCIICPEHGEFWQIPSAHVRGHSCPKCANAKRGRKTVTTDSLIAKLKIVHNNRYSYEKVVYVNADTKICITCPIHGDFYMLPYLHLNGQICPKCNNRNLTQEDILYRFKKTHGDRYDYSKVYFTKTKEKVCIICPEHGEFWQTPQKHIKGQGCPKCGIERRLKEQVLTNETYIQRANKVHGGKYGYDWLHFNSLHDKVNIKCPIHGYFEQIAYDHLNGHGCPVCGQQISLSECEIGDFIRQCGNQIETRIRNIIYPYELDIYVPSKKVAVEYNGLRWHNEQFKKDKNYHLIKTELCKRQGIHLIHVFEDEWLEHKDIIKSKIKHILGNNTDLPKVFARKCVINEIDSNLSNSFLTNNHIQGKTNSSLYLGCFYQDKLVGVMSFKKERKDSDKWELTRFASDITKCCIGVGGKLFKYFIKKYNPLEVKSFADRRWSTDTDNLYTKLGFVLDNVLKPDYKYIIPNTNKRFHKFNFRKQILHKKYNLPLTMTENEMTQKIKAYKIWDCGLYKYKWKRKDL